MKGTKTSLFLIELMISLLLFAFCAAICVQLFHASNMRTAGAEDLEKAVFHATTAAEVYKSTGGDIEALSATYDDAKSYLKDGVLTIYYDEDWVETLHPMLRATLYSSGYTLKISDNGNNCADITVTRIVRQLDSDIIVNVSEDIFNITVKAVAS